MASYALCPTGYLNAEDAPVFVGEEGSLTYVADGEARLSWSVRLAGSEVLQGNGERLFWEPTEKGSYQIEVTARNAGCTIKTTEVVSIKSRSKDEWGMDSSNNSIVDTNIEELISPSQQSNILWGTTDFLVYRAQEELSAWLLDRYVDEKLCTTEVPPGWLVAPGVLLSNTCQYMGDDLQGVLFGDTSALRMHIEQDLYRMPRMLALGKLAQVTDAPTQDQVFSVAILLRTMELLANDPDLTVRKALGSWAGSVETLGLGADFPISWSLYVTSLVAAMESDLRSPYFTQALWVNLGKSNPLAPVVVQGVADRYRQATFTPGESGLRFKELESLLGVAGPGLAATFGPEVTGCCGSTRSEAGRTLSWGF